MTDLSNIVISRLQALFDAGSYAECLTVINSFEFNSFTEIALVREIIQTAIISHEYDFYKSIQQALQKYGGYFNDDPEFLGLSAYCYWVMNDTETAIATAKKAVGLEPDNPKCYQILSLSYLSKQQFFDAFISVSAGINNCRDSQTEGAFLSQRQLAYKMLTNDRIVRFSLDEQEFIFNLTCFNGQAIEASSYHLNQTLTELDELRFLRDRLSKHLVLVEVGSLVGNHLLYLAKQLQPTKIMVFEASTNSIHAIKMNLFLNGLPSQQTDVQIQHLAVGGTAGTIDFFGEQVPMNSLDQVITEKVDFLKIDVDGEEMDVLAGAKQTIQTYRPQILIEIKQSNLAAFKDFLLTIDYAIVETFEHGNYSNFYIEPVG